MCANKTQYITIKIICGQAKRGGVSKGEEGRVYCCCYVSAYKTYVDLQNLTLICVQVCIVHEFSSSVTNNMYTNSKSKVHNHLLLL